MTSEEESKRCDQWLTEEDTWLVIGRRKEETSGAKKNRGREEEKVWLVENKRRDGVGVVKIKYVVSGE